MATPGAFIPGLDVPLAPSVQGQDIKQRNLFDTPELLQQKAENEALAVNIMLFILFPSILPIICCLLLSILLVNIILRVFTF